MVGEPVPDPIAQDLLASPGLASVCAQLHAHGIDTMQPLGYGASSVVLDACDGRVVRLGFGALVALPPIPEVLQPLASGTAGHVRFEIMPRADTHGMTDADVRDVAARLAQRGYEFSDAGPDNIGRIDGRVVVIDPGAVSDQLRQRSDDEKKRPSRYIPAWLLWIGCVFFRGGHSFGRRWWANKPELTHRLCEDCADMATPANQDSWFHRERAVG